jgi:hypothetical protein
LRKPTIHHNNNINNAKGSLLFDYYWELLNLFFWYPIAPSSIILRTKRQHFQPKQATTKKLNSLLLRFATATNRQPQPLQPRNQLQSLYIYSCFVSAGQIGCLPVTVLATELPERERE